MNMAFEKVAANYPSLAAPWAEAILDWGQLSCS